MVYTKWSEWSKCEAPDCEKDPNLAFMTRTQTNVADKTDIRTETIRCKSPCPPGKNVDKNKVSFSPSLASSAQLIVSLSRLFSIGSQRNANAYWPPLSYQPNRLKAKDREYFSSCYGRFLLFAQNNFNTCPALRSQEAKRAQNLRGLTKRGRSKGQRKGLALPLNSKTSSRRSGLKATRWSRTARGVNLVTRIATAV